MSGLGSRIAGVAAAPGVARGPWARVTPAALPGPRGIGQKEVEAEAARLQEAAIASARELRELAARVRESGHAEEAAIFTAHAAMARDPELLDAARAEIRDGRSDAVTAITRAAQRAADSIGSLDDQLLRGRAADVLDVGDRIARRLAGLPPSSHRLTSPAIVVADDLPPSVTATLPRDMVLGIALQGSSPTAHAAILARAYGIPAVVGVAGLMDALDAAGAAAELALDGSTGEVVVAPDPSEQTRFDALASTSAEAGLQDRVDASLPAITRDGVEVTLLANIGGVEEANRALELGAQGVGLFRTEFLFLERTEPPSEEEQVQAYRSVLESFAGLPVTVRLLDVGGDKAIPYLPIEPEENPFLGVRALRLADRYSDVFVTQLRACMRASAATPMRVMAPMIADADDVETFLALAETARAGVEADGVAPGVVELGIMLEIPSAALTMPTYAGRISFASLGTNDLLQYALAVDRGNAALERYRDPMHPALLTLIGIAVSHAAAARLSLSVCGEMAGDPVCALALIGLGIRNLSMASSSLPAVRRAIRAASAAELAALAAEATAAPSAATSRALFTRV